MLVISFSFIISCVLVIAASNPSWSYWDIKSDVCSFQNITSIDSNTDAFSMSRLHYSQADCDTLVLSWMADGKLNYRLFYCFFKYGWFRQEKGFYPFFSFMEQQHSRTIHSFEALVIESTEFGTLNFSSVDAHPATFALSSAQDSKGVVLGVSSCWSIQSNLYDAEACNEDFISARGALVECRNSSFDVDRDILGKCEYHLYRNVDLHEPNLGALDSDQAITASEQIYYHKDIPDHDESPQHADATRHFIPHMVSTLFALKDLSGNGFVDVVLGGIELRPVTLWDFGSVNRTCCQQERSIDSGSADAQEIFGEWVPVVVNNRFSSLSEITSGNPGWFMDPVSQRVLPDGSWRRPGRGFYDPLDEAFDSNDADIEFEWGLDPAHVGSFAHGEAGFMFGMKRDLRNYYVYIIDNHRACGNVRYNYAEVLVKVTDGSMREIATNDFPSFFSGQKHIINIQLTEGGFITIDRDGVRRFTYQDPSNVHHGSYGFYVWDQQGAYFDDILINTRSSSADRITLSEPTIWSHNNKNNKFCRVKFYVHRYLNENDYVAQEVDTSQFPPLSGCANLNSPITCTSSWITFDSNPKPDLLVHCVVGTSVQYRVGLNWDVNGPFSWQVVEEGDLTVGMNGKASFVPIDFADYPPVPHNGVQVEPMMVVTEVNGALRYRHMFRM
ncbi:hypothetical protein GEMRC1_004036 [Eukaryota sp. GEM-RC1]